MVAKKSVREVVARIRKLVGPDQFTFLSLLEAPNVELGAALGALADEDNGGVLAVLGDHHLVDDDGGSPFDRLEHIFPIAETDLTETTEGWLWVAVIAGIEGAPEPYAGATDHLRTAELTPLVDADLGELDLTPLQETRAGLKAMKPSDLYGGVLFDKKSIWHRGLATVRDGRVVPTVAGMIALGRHPYQHLPGMCIELNLHGERRCWRGTLRELDARAHDVSAPCLQPGRNKFRELLMNALLHRGWRHSDWRRPIQVTASEGRLEITHPGLLDDWRVGKSTPVNPRLFALAHQLGFAHGKGTGLQTVESYLIKKQLRPLELSAHDDAVRLEVCWPFPAKRQAKPQEPVHRPASLPPAATASTYTWDPSVDELRHMEHSSMPPTLHNAVTNRPSGAMHGTPQSSAPLPLANTVPEVNRAASTGLMHETRGPVAQAASRLLHAGLGGSVMGTPPSFAPTTAPSTPGLSPVREVRLRAAAQVMATSAPEYSAASIAGSHAPRSATAVEPALFAAAPHRASSAAGMPPPPTTAPAEAQTSPRQNLSQAAPVAVPNAMRAPAAPVTHTTARSATPTSPERPVGAGHTHSGSDTSLPARPASPGHTRSGSDASLPARPAAAGHKHSVSGASLPARPAGAGHTHSGADASPPARPAGAVIERSAATTSDRTAHGSMANTPKERKDSHPEARAATTLGAASVEPRNAGPKVQTSASASMPPASPDRNDKDRAVVELLRQRGSLTTQELMQALGWTRWAARTALERLIDSGIIRAAAPSPRSPLQTYELV